MSDWVLVPCLVALRSEFNAVAPNRDRGADGAIGDSNHKSSSDHTPDEDSDVLRDHDADDKNEVHALDIDSSGPWPGGPAWFDDAILALVERERAEYLSPTAVGRLKYVIWNRRIAERSNGWRWRKYTATADPHTNHAHFSARYESGPEADTRPWGIQEDDMTPEEIAAAVLTALKSPAGQDAISKALLNETLGASKVTVGQALQGTNLKAAALVAAVAAIPGATVAELGDATRTVEEQAALLRAVLGDRATEVGRLLSGQA